MREKDVGRTGRTVWQLRQENVRCGQIRKQINEMTGLRLQLLGPFEVRLENDLPVVISGKKSKALLAYLALAGGAPQRSVVPRFTDDFHVRAASYAQDDRDGCDHEAQKGAKERGGRAVESSTIVAKQITDPKP